MYSRTYNFHVKGTGVLTGCIKSFKLLSAKMLNYWFTTSSHEPQHQESQRKGGCDTNCKHHSLPRVQMAKLSVVLFQPARQSLRAGLIPAGTKNNPSAV